MPEDETTRIGWSTGERVRVDIPDETNPRHHRYHGRHGTIVAKIPPSNTNSDAYTARKKCRVEFDTGGSGDFYATELRPPISR